MTEIATERFQTLEFDGWHSQLATAIGHHRSTLLTPGIPFVSSIEAIHSVPIRKVVRSGCLNCAPLSSLHQFVP